MESVSAHQFLMIYTWFALTALVFLMALIARFYERLSGERTYYRLFGVPVVAFAGATVRMALAALCLHMYRLMTSGR
jgi:hypothetical protein